MIQPPSNPSNSLFSGLSWRSLLWLSLASLGTFITFGMVTGQEFSPVSSREPQPPVLPPPLSPQPLSPQPSPPAVFRPHPAGKSSLPEKTAQQSQSAIRRLQSEPKPRKQQGSPSSVAPASPQRSTSTENPFRQLLNQSSEATPSPPTPVSTPSPGLPATPERPLVPFTLSEVVQLTVARNTAVKNAYLERIVHRASLWTAQGLFVPNITPKLEGRIEGNGQNWGIQGTTEFLELGAGIAVLTPLGGTFQIDWLSQLRSLQNGELLDSDQWGGSLRQGVTFQYQQPLLRDAGVAVTRLRLDQALLEEDINFLNFRDTLAEEITQSIKLYTALLGNQKQVENTQISLENARKELERQQALVEAGRFPRISLLRFQRNIANFESQLLAAQNSVQSAQAALLNQLRIEQDINLIAAEDLAEITQELVALDLKAIQETAQKKRSNYLIGILQTKINELQVLQAKNDRRWRLDLNTRFQEGLTKLSDFSARLILTRELGTNRQADEAIKRAEINLLQQKNRTQQIAQEIATEVGDRVREIQLKYQQIQLAQQSVQLAQQELTAQQALLEAGRGDVFQLQQAQTEVLVARNAVVQTQIEYLNAIADLQQTQGTTLEHWQIVLNPEEIPRWDEGQVNSSP